MSSTSQAPGGDTGEGPGRGGPPRGGEPDGREWLDSLPAELAPQRRVMAGLLDFCAATPLVTSLSVGCSLGRGAGDALSDIDAALGVAAERGEAGAERVIPVEAALAATLPGIAPLVDVLRYRTGGPDRRLAWRIFAQFADRAQLDLAVIAEAEVRRGDAAPDFVSVYRAPGPGGEYPVPCGHAGPPEAEARPPEAAADDHPAAHVVSGDQIREWAFLGWVALIDMDKYLRRGSVWEAHGRLHEAREHIWALWAAAAGAIYPWHGLSQVLDEDPRNLPLGIESTVAGLDPAGLRRAANASATVLAEVSAAAADRCPADLPLAMAAYVTGILGAAGPPGAQAGPPGAQAGPPEAQAG